MEKLSMFRVLSVVVMLLICGGEGRCPRPDEIAPCQCRTRGPSIQVRCVNSMMQRIQEAMLNIRNVVESVDVLILENNNIPHLPSRALGSVKVNRLFLENNRIQTIDRNAFAGLENYITEIYIKEKQLRLVPKDAIDFLKKLTVFSIESSLITEMPRVVGLKNLKLFKIDGSNITNIPEFTLQNLPGLRYLHVTNSNLHRIEAGILENLPYLLLANFTGNQISWIHPRAFRYMEQLEQVVLSQNHIEDARTVGQAVKVIKTIKRLDLSHNRIDKLRDASFIDIVSLEELDLSNNRLVLMQRSALHRLPRLQLVDLSNNEIRSFHSDVFMDTPVVQELNLNSNKISRVTDVSFMIDSLPLLRILDLGHNLFSEVPFGALRGYPKLERLLLSNNDIGDLSQEAFFDLPSLTELDLSGNRLTSLSVDGKIFSLPNLQVLNLSDNKLSSLKRRLFESLASLRRLNLANNGIGSLEEDCLQPVRNLDYLNISSNSIRELSPDLLSGLSRLYELDISYNELVTLSDHTFIDQKRLEFLSLSNNQIQLISSHIFSQVNSVRYLDLSSNYITEFPAALIRKLGSLDRLLFRRNSIQNLDESSFEGLSSLQYIDLNDNRIQTIHNRAFKDLIELKSLDLSLNVISTVGSSLEPAVNLIKLNLSDNYITTLPFTAFKSLTRLSTLDLSNNTIVDIGKAFVNMPELKFLDLSYNHLPSVATGAFSSLPKLISLHLDHNSIIRIEPNSFQQLWDLERLYLSKNGISAILTGTFRNMPSLERLYLDDNLIKELDEKSLQNLLSLKELHLEYNLIKTINERAFHQIPSIRYLNLSYNLLQDLSRYGFYGLETLETIDLSFNDIRMVDDRAFETLKWLVHLKLNDNNICKITGKAFKDASSLRRLELNNNRIFKLQEQAFTQIKRNVDKLDVSGNPLNCDCETRWLRDLVSRQNYYGNSEPRCYFPKALSGSPLRQLRSSRFTCNQGNSLVQDACQSLPLKTPAQLHMTAIQEGNPETLGSFNIKFDGDTASVSAVSTTTDPTTPIISLSTSALEADKTSDIINLVNEVVDSELEKSANISSQEQGSGSEDYEYEYVYYYYDESGDNGTIVDVKPASSIIKLANVSNDIHTSVGDTPTIYAGASNSSEKAEEGDEDGDGGGLSIFGIPIPSIPISLSFGLAPAISQIVSSGGLLPIGRKGEASQEKQETLENVKEVLSTIKDFTRGPDKDVPVWVDKLKDIDYSKIAALLPNVLKSKAGETVNSKDRPEEYMYQSPPNPVIPLSSEVGEQPRTASGYFPLTSGTFNNGYFPKEAAESPPSTGYTGPVHQMMFPPATHHTLPPPLLGNRNYGVTDQQEGFKPVFIPNSRDDLQGDQAQRDTVETLRQYSQILRERNPSAFPEIDATINYVDQDLTTTSRRPAINFEDKEARPQTVLRQPQQYEEVFIEYVDPYDLPEKELIQRSTASPSLGLVGDIPARQDHVTATTTTLYDTRRSKENYGHLIPKTVSQKKQEVIHQIMETKKKNGFEIYEVSSKEPVIIPETEAELNVGVTHKGTPMDDATATTETVSSEPEYTYEYVYEYYYDDEDPDLGSTDQPSTSTSSSTASTTTTASSTESTSSSLMSLLSFLNAENSPDNSNIVSSSYRQPPLASFPPPTSFPAFRSTTGNYEDNFLDNRRSGMSVDFEEREGRSSSSSPRARSSTTDLTSESRSLSTTQNQFNLDQADPAEISSSQSSQENSVNWYYSEYNHETSKPFIGPGAENFNSGKEEPSPLSIIVYLIIAMQILVIH